LRAENLKRPAERIPSLGNLTLYSSRNINSDFKVSARSI
jgi:hypothetical protein